MLTEPSRKRSPPTAHEIEVALGLGFARLMALEAGLELVESRGGRTAAGAGSRAAAGLVAQINALRRTLADVRNRTRRVDPSQQLVGFVLPARAAEESRHHDTPR